MNSTAVINIRVEPKVKREAHKVAEELGLSLSGLVHGFLKNLIRTKSADFRVSERPSKYLIESLKEAEKDIKEGWVSPNFTEVDDAIAWLRDPKAKYVNQLRKKI